MSEKTKNVLSMLRFRENDIGAMHTVFEGINVTAIEKLGQLVLIYDYVDNRTAVAPTELALPLDSNMQQIADALLKIHESVFGKKG